MSHTAETFIEYVQAVEREVKASGHKLGRDIILYRGVRSADWTLLPSIAWRKGSGGSPRR